MLNSADFPGDGKPLRQQITHIPPDSFTRARDDRNELPEDREEAAIVNCGHPAPLLVHGATARFAEPPEADPPLGLAELVTPRRKQYSVPFGPGDQLLFYTDGISEARDSQGDFYPLHQRGALLAGLSPAPALRRLFSDILRHVGHQLNDDCVALIICRFPSRDQDPNRAAGLG